MINGRKLTKRAYNETTVDFWPCNQNLILECSLKGGDKDENDAENQLICKYGLQIKEIYPSIPENLKKMIIWLC
jgi:hypothetical protein